MIEEVSTSPHACHSPCSYQPCALPPSYYHTLCPSLSYHKPACGPPRASTAPPSPMQLRRGPGRVQERGAPPVLVEPVPLAKQESLDELRSSVHEAASHMERSTNDVCLLGRKMAAATERMSASVQENAQALATLAEVVEKLQRLVAASKASPTPSLSLSPANSTEAPHTDAHFNHVASCQIPRYVPNNATQPSSTSSNGAPHYGNVPDIVLPSDDTHDYAVPRSDAVSNLPILKHSPRSRGRLVRHSPPPRKPRCPSCSSSSSSSSGSITFLQVQPAKTQGTSPNRMSATVSPNGRLASRTPSASPRRAADGHPSLPNCMWLAKAESNSTGCLSGKKKRRKKKKK